MRRRAGVILAIAIGAAACGNRGASSDHPTSGSAPTGGSASGTSSSGSAASASVSDAVRARVCATEPCGGPRSSIDVYRDATGNVRKLYRLYGPCSHNPGIYFDPDGTQTEIIPEKPIVPGSDEANEIQAKHDKQVGGLTKAESLDCR